MQEGGIMRNFLLPVTAIGFFIGVLTAAWVPWWCAMTLCVITGAELFFAANPPALFVFVCAGACGVLRSQAQNFLPALPFTNPFLLLAHATQTRLQIIHDLPSRAFAVGLLLGGTSLFTADWKQVFRATGVSHIVAVSGSNVSILVVALGHVLSRAQFFPRQRALIATLMLFAFVCVTGAPLSVVRAALMALFMESATLLGRVPLGLHALGAATLLIGMISPAAFSDIGFQLSAGAALGLILAEESAEKNRWVRALHATVAATLCTLPLSVFYFGSTSAIALIANLLIVPLVPLLMGAAGVAYVASFFPHVVAAVLVTPSESVLHVALFVLEKLARVPGSLMRFSVPLWAVLLWYAGIATWAIYTYTAE